MSEQMGTRVQDQNARANVASRHAATPRQAYTVGEFCEAYRLSRTTLYDLWKRGQGPRHFHAGAKVLITTDAAREWAGGVVA